MSASSNIRAFMEKVRSDQADGAFGQADAEMLTELSQRLLELMEL